jgi:hypothetical protein
MCVTPTGHSQFADAQSVLIRMRHSSSLETSATSGRVRRCVSFPSRPGGCTLSACLLIQKKCLLPLHVARGACKSHTHPLGRSPDLGVSQACRCRHAPGAAQRGAARADQSRHCCTDGHHGARLHGSARQAGAAPESLVCRGRRRGARDGRGRCCTRAGRVSRVHVIVYGCSRS